MYVQIYYRFILGNKCKPVTSHLGYKVEYTLRQKKPSTLALGGKVTYDDSVPKCQARI